MKEIIEQNFIYIIVDETTDTRGLYITNLPVRVINKEFSGKPYLLASNNWKK